MKRYIKSEHQLLLLCSDHLIIVKLNNKCKKWDWTSAPKSQSATMRNKSCLPNVAIMVKWILGNGFWHSLRNSRVQPWKNRGDGPKLRHPSPNEFYDKINHPALRIQTPCRSIVLRLSAPTHIPANGGDVCWNPILHGCPVPENYLYHLSRQSGVSSNPTEFPKMRPHPSFLGVLHRPVLYWNHCS